MEGRHSPMLSICLAARYTLGPSVPNSTSDAGYSDGPRQMSIILDAAFCRDRAYWSSMSTFVCISPTSRWRCTAAVTASPLESRSTHCLPLSSSNPADCGTLIHSRNRGWFNRRPYSPAGSAKSDALYVVFLNAQPGPSERIESTDLSSKKGPSWASRHLGTILYLSVVRPVVWGKAGIRTSSGIAPLFADGKGTQA